jgi:hypothetical protein
MLGDTRPTSCAGADALERRSDVAGAAYLLHQLLARSVDLEVLVSQNQVVSRPKLAAANADAIDDGAVRRFQIAENPRLVAEYQARMAARNRRVREHDIATLMTPEQQLSLVTNPVKRKQERPALNTDRTADPNAPHRCNHGPHDAAVASASGSSKAQVTDQRERIDQPRL